ncbi:hypothetical protein BDR07DRAFT_194824 [Suillus spraguei]|nr:hypothetical protein BDR07DRAFT_194824 [Suillus spraguei]
MLSYLHPVMELLLDLSATSTYNLPQCNLVTNPRALYVKFSSLSLKRKSAPLYLLHFGLCALALHCYQCRVLHSFFLL